MTYLLLWLIVWRLPLNGRHQLWSTFYQRIIKSVAIQNSYISAIQVLGLKVSFLEKFNWQNKSTFHCISDIPDWISLKRINHRQIMKTFFASIKKLDSYDSSFRLISFLIRIHDPLPFDSWSFRNMGSFRQINFSCIIFHIFLGSSIILKVEKNDGILCIWRGRIGEYHLNSEKLGCNKDRGWQVRGLYWT